VKTGTWKRNGKDLVINHGGFSPPYHGGSTPDRSDLQEMCSALQVPSGQGLRPEKDRVDFRRDPLFNDIGFLATLISCDRLYYDGHKVLDGPPCMPPAMRP